MLPVQYKITAYSKKKGARIELFTWCRSDAEAGIRRAKEDAKHFNMADDLSDYQVEKIGNFAP